MTGKQETSAASTNPETFHSESLSVLDLETEFEKAKASLVALGKRISALKNRLNTPEQQFGDRALIADLQKKFIAETHTFNLIKRRLESSQDDSEAAYQAAVVTLLGGGEVFAAPLLELTAEKEPTSNGIPETVAPQEPASTTAQQTVTQDTVTPSTPSENSSVENEDDEDDEAEPENTTEPPKKNFHRRTKDSYLKVERAQIQVTVHERLVGHCLSGKTSYLEIDTLIAPLLNRPKVYYKDYDLIDDDEVAKLAEQTGYQLDILPGQKGRGGNKKSYRYIKKPSDASPARLTPTPEPLRAVAQVPRSTTPKPQNGRHRTPETTRRTTVFNNTSNQAKPMPQAEKVAASNAPERKISTSVELSYLEIKTVISQSYSNHKETFRRLVGAEPGEISLTRAARILIQDGHSSFPSNALRDYEIASYESANWMITAPVFVAIYNLLMEGVAFDEAVGDAFKEVKTEELAKVTAEVHN